MVESSWVSMSSPVTSSSIASAEGLCRQGRAQGEDGHVVVAVAGVVVDKGLAEVVQGQVAVGGRGLGEGVEAGVDGVLGVLDQSVGDEDHGGAGGERVGVVRVGLVGVHSEGDPGIGMQVLRPLAGGDDQGREMARVAPAQGPGGAFGFDAGQAGGGEGVVGDGVQSAVKLREDCARRGTVRS